MFRAGQQIGIYSLVKRLGRGAFGEVWLAERRAKFVTTKVAVKLPLDEQVEHDAIKQEASVWEQASGHPNVLPIIDADEYDGQIVIVSEYAPDGSLEDLLRKNGGSLPIKQAVEMATGILSGLEFLHSRKIIHRDIKPANILLQGETPRLADFGISRVVRTNSMSANLTGTPCYMAPEAFDKKRNVQTDIWSVGVVLYQMLKGELPFTAQNITDLLGAIITGEPESLPDSIPPALKKIVAKALAKRLPERYKSAREMRDHLTNFLVSDLQQNIQPTFQAEELPKTSSALLLAQTQVGPTTKNFESPDIDLQKGKSKILYIKILAPAATIILLALGGLLFKAQILSPTPAPIISSTPINVTNLPTNQSVSNNGRDNSTTTPTPTPTPIASNSNSDSRTEMAQKVILDNDAKNKLIGSHRLALQWIGSDNFGKAIVTDKNGTLYIKGKVQRGPNYLKIDGKITKVESKSFVFNGIIDVKVINNSSKPCRRKGEMNFMIPQGENYWQLQEMENPCYQAIDYVDIHF